MKTLYIASNLILVLLGSLACKKENTKTTQEITISEDVPVTDYDGIVYKTVKIGNQIWMSENLRVSHYRNGDEIPKVTENSLWAGLSTGAYCAYNNTYNADFVNTYGMLYNWYAANDSRSIAPVGWHIPSITEWQTLVDYLGGNSVAGSKLKEIGTTHWQSPNSGASNESRFTALPSGNRDGNGGVFRNLGKDAYLALISNDSKTWFSYLDFESAGSVSSSDVYKQDGFAIRCIKD